MLGSFQAF
jgi:hypothetical protein